MSLPPLWRSRIFAGLAAVIAIWMGVQVADGNLVWPSAMALLVLLFLTARFQPVPVGTVALGVIVFGYVVGNRGFAQLMLSPSLPLLPAEGVLLLGGALLLVQCAWRHELPARRDSLNLAILAWMLIGSLRLYYDFRTFGVMALRDFALVYYASFFFLAQEAASQEWGYRFLTRTLLASFVFLPIVFWLSQTFPTLFLQGLVLRGNPVIFYKGDLVGMFLAAGSVLAFATFEANEKRRWIFLSLGLAAASLATNSRSSMLALVVAALLLAARRRWRYGAWLAGSGAAAVVLTLLAALVLRIPWEKTPVFGVYERVVSLVDPLGQRTYSGENTYFKGDNNLFRAVWWRAVIDETVDGNPYLGLGFGQDLAGRFIREYYPETGDEFSTRSPHNVLLTLFARMGVVGLAMFLTVLVIMAVHTWRAIPRDATVAGLWCTVWIILVCACLGVVLEGPMGAVVFWTTLGIAYANSTSLDTDDESHRVEAARLQTSVPSP